MLNLKILAGGLVVLATAGWAGAQSPSFVDSGVAADFQFLHRTGGYTNWDYTGGGSVGDFDRDGWSDVFAVSGGTLNVPDKLFMNEQDGTFADEAAAWGLTTIHLGKGSCVGDYNNDGWQDIYVVSAGQVGGGGQSGQHKLYENSGTESFANVAVAAGVNFTTTANPGDGMGACFGDYDLDGDLDLFVAGFAFNNVGSRIFRNNGDETFTDVTNAIGLWAATPDSRSCFSPSFSDFDGDDYPELAIASDFGDMTLFQNDADGTFTEVSGPAGIDDAENGMGSDVRDLDADGDRDWYVTSIFLPAFNWTGNKLHTNTSTLGNVTFGEIGEAAGVDDGGYGWGTVLADFNHDGLVDIAETNGDSSNSGTFFGEQSYLWMNDGDGTFTEQAVSAGLVHNGKGRGMSHLDMDNDGDQDVIIYANGEDVKLYENTLISTAVPSDAHWLRVFLDTGGTGLAPDGYGSEVFVTVGGTTQMDNIDGTNHHMSTSELSAHFGVGTATVIDEVKVTWNDGSETVLTNVAADQTITITPAGDPWVDLGLAKAGQNGLPALDGTGTLQAGTPLSLDLTNAFPFATANLFIGLTNIGSPFKGGVLVPSPDFLIPGLPIDGAGALSLASTWPAGVPAGTPFYFQHWISGDPGPANGFAASNGLEGTAQ